MVRRVSCCAAIALLLVASTALADRVAVLPTRGGTDEGARSNAQAAMLSGLIALGHAPVPDEALRAALRGVADTADEYKTVAAATGAQWVLAGTVEPAVATARIELTAYLASNGRVESVAREIDQRDAQQQTKEVLAVLVRPEGVGIGELPWEHPAARQPAAAPHPPPADVTLTPPPPRLPAAPVAPPEDVVVIDYPLGTQRVWPAYSAGKRPALSALLGFSVAADRSDAASGSAASLVGSARFGYALGDRGLELLVAAGGNLAGPPAGWIEAGARFLLTPSLTLSGSAFHATALHFGPEVTVGALFLNAGSGVAGPGGTKYSSSIEAHPVIGASFDIVFALSPTFQLEAQVGDLRWVPAGAGSLLLLGARAGAGLRF